MYKTTKQHKKYWENRKIDWKKAYLDTWNHPHRTLISNVVRSAKFGSLWEVGCGPGPNLARIVKDVGRPISLGGSDINEDAIELAKKTFKGGMFHVESGDDLLMSDNSVDIVLSDMSLIYVDPTDIDKYLKEFQRIARNYVVLVEFHSTSWWKRQKARFTNGYHVYNYVKRLRKLGFWDIQKYQIPESMWPGADSNTEFRTLVTARI